MQAPGEQCLLAAQTFVDAFKEAEDSCAETLAVFIHWKLGLLRKTITIFKSLCLDIV